MGNLPEFIELLRQIRDKYYVEIKEMWDKVNINKDKVQHIADMMAKIHVSKTVTIPNNPDGTVADADAHFDGVHGTFEFGIPQGIAGQAGQKGHQGVPGVQGVDGAQGHTGPRGNQGTPGIDGNKGDKGSTGPQGIRGQEGPQGIQGVRGLHGQGLDFGRAYNTLADLLAAETHPQLEDIHLVLFQADGQTRLGNLYVFDNPTPPHDIAGAGWHNVGHVQGPAGQQGVQGIPGPQGVGVTIKGSDTEAVIKAKQGASAGDLWVSTDDGHAWVWDGKQWENVGAFKGEKGDQGVAGPQGIEGKQGARGHDGATGPQGNPGHQGNEGPQGPVGADGPKGSKGLKGDEGPRGKEGPKGHVGDAGRDGKDGKDGTSAVYATQAEVDAGTSNAKAVTPKTLKASYVKSSGDTMTGNLNVKSSDTSGGMYVYSPLDANKYVFKLGYKSSGEGALYSNKTGQVITYKLDGSIDIAPKSGKKLTYNGVEIATISGTHYLPITGGTLTGALNIDVTAGWVDLTGKRAGTSIWKIGTSTKTSNDTVVKSYTGDLNLLGKKVKANGKEIVTGSYNSATKTLTLDV